MPEKLNLPWKRGNTQEKFERGDPERNGEEIKKKPPLQSSYILAVYKVCVFVYVWESHTDICREERGGESQTA